MDNLCILDLKYAYLAGLIDGEGCISITKTRLKDSLRPRYCLRLSIAMTDSKTIAFLGQEFGGSIFYKENTKGENAKPVDRWSTTTNNADSLLLKVLPYLICKRAQAELAIRFQTSIRERIEGHKIPLTDEEIQVRDEMIEQLHILNKRGMR